MSTQTRFYENWSLGKFVHVAQRTWKTRPTAKYASANRPKKLFKELFPNILN